MAWRGKAGSFRETHRSKTSVSFEWRIPNIISMPAATGDYYCSPSIKLSDTIWYLSVYPKGKPWTSKWISLALVRCNVGRPVNFSLGIKVAAGVEEEVTRHQIFPERQTSFLSTKFLHSPELVSRRFELAPYDSLTVSCTIWSYAPSQEGLPGPSAPRNGLERDTDARDEEREDLKLKGFSSLRKQLKDLLVAGDDHDVTIKVGDREFGAHRTILRARSRVFKAMFEHEMKESVDGSVTVKDCHPDAFGEFLHYIYTGDVEDLSVGNAVWLYHAADKYDVLDLKEICAHFLKTSLTATVVCDVISLATTHAECELLEQATSFFMENTKEVLETSEWRSFVKNNPDEANELYMKSFENLTETKTKG